ncbi:conserved hypothetical protein [Carboxydothermus islandicus]|uniref:MobA-like NTP transferase domain-containing protein n=1 Tax=Carboxydothermus islandicus TaxID=661089 RepID=A0A1L8D5P2_9THEO|nr:conserved hypothetical protein [Carboxydothermus islandicus]
MALPLFGKTILEQTEATYRRVFAEVVVVTKDRVSESAALEGMGGTLREAARLLPGYWQGVVIALGDMPFVGISSLQALLQAIEKNPEEVWCLSYRGQRGHPVYLPGKYFSCLKRLTGDTGLRDLLPELNPKYIDTEDYGVLFDIDKPDDYLSFQRLVVVKGAGDIATGIIWRLHQAGFKVVATELSKPTAIRRMVAFAQAIYTGEHTVEGVTARKANLEEVPNLLANGIIPVIPDEKSIVVKELKPWAVIDARLAKKNLGTKKEEAEIVIGVGPGFTAPVEVHAVIETKRGHYLGRAIYQGSALPDTGIPGEIGGHTVKRVVYSPGRGKICWYFDFGQEVKAGEVIGTVGEKQIVAEVSGVIRGLIHPEVRVEEGMKIGDIDPRGIKEYAFTISEKALAVAGGVLEVLLKLGNPGLK